MKLVPCLPAIVYLVLAAGTVLSAYMKKEQARAQPILPTLVTVLTVTTVLQVLCQYGHSKLAWGLLAAMVVLPLVLILLMILMVGAVAK